MAKFYAVRKGVKPGVYTTWPECEAQVKGFSGAEYKSFSTELLAKEYLADSTILNIIAHDTGSRAIIDLKGNMQIRGAIEIYVDGGFKNGIYSWAFVVLYNNELYHSKSGIGTRASSINNVAGELSAVMRACQYVKNNWIGMRPVIIYHDYTGIANWVTGSWKANNEFTKSYVDYMQEYKQYIIFKHVNGHTGNQWNEHVDNLCTQELAKALNV